jgi:hypothetical protein
MVSISRQQTATPNPQRKIGIPESKQAERGRNSSSPLTLIQSLGKLNASSSGGHPIAKKLIELAKGDKLSSLLRTGQNPKKAWMETLGEHGGKIVKGANDTYDVVCPFNGDLLTLRQGLLPSDVREYYLGGQAVPQAKTLAQREKARQDRSPLSRAAEEARSTN